MGVVQVHDRRLLVAILGLHAEIFVGQDAFLDAEQPHFIAEHVEVDLWMVPFREHGQGGVEPVGACDDARPGRGKPRRLQHR